jgi:hypothetical protein
MTAEGMALPYFRFIFAILDRTGLPMQEPQKLRGMKRRAENEERKTKSEKRRGKSEELK